MPTPGDRLLAAIKASGMDARLPWSSRLDTLR